MPEGDAVMRTARRLDAALAGRRLVAAELRWPTVAGLDLAGRTVLGTGTVGKHLLTRFDDGRTLHTHLRMEGSWQVRRTAADARFPSDARVLLVAEQWTGVGCRLGMVDVLRTHDEAAFLGHLGPDVLAPGWDRDRAVANVRAQGERGIGETLLDQTVVAGIGTIYMAEALWSCGISPWTSAGTLGDPGALLDRARYLMQRSVAGPVATATGDIRPGRQSHVHGRAGRGCPRCRGEIIRGEVGTPPYTRPAFYCPGCQPGG